MEKLNDEIAFYAEQWNQVSSNWGNLSQGHYIGFEFEALCKAALTKAKEFIDFQVSQPISHAYFQLGTLRSICEDFIAISYLIQQSPNEREDKVRNQIEWEVHTSLIRQKKFFSHKNRMQNITNPSYVMSQERILELSESRGSDIFPSVWSMASQTNLKEFYSFIYFATSQLVHFSPMNLGKMGWTNQYQKGKSNNFSYSTAHTQEYYKYFGLFYSIYIFVELSLTLNDSFQMLTDPANDALLKIQEHMNLPDTYWPEILMFSHMNISFGGRILNYIMNKEEGKDAV